MDTPKFDYALDIKSAWPPRRRPKPPYGPSAIEVMRSCALRSLFEISPGYQRRMGFAARIGAAFHRALQSLDEQPLPSRGIQEAAEEARRRFQFQLKIQEEQADQRPRERGLPRDQERASRAAEALVVEALRMIQQGTLANGDVHYGGQHSPLMKATHPSGKTVASGLPRVEVEVPLQSKDGLFRGRVDRAEHRSDGTWLFDYKAALREDLPERYSRQLQLYAFIWHDARGEWPVQARVLYPLAGREHAVSIHPGVCQQVAAESLQTVSRLQGVTRAEHLATPGDVCRVCEFRPWCAPFWKWQAEEPSLTRALENSFIGFEGQIRRITLENYRWRLRIAWRDAEVQLQAAQERLPQLAKAEVGTDVRVLDTVLRGLRHHPKATITGLSELFLIRRRGSTGNTEGD